jgi:RNA polymerase sigma factor (TIGR02999 family)
MSLVYDELRGLASGYFRNRPPGATLQPTALVHEAFLRLTGRDDLVLRDRAHFMAVCAVVMRGILADHARRRGAAKRGGGWQRVSLSGVVTPAADDTDVDVVALDRALSKLAGLNERQARVIECRFFAGMTVEEVGESLGVSKGTVESDWRMARAWLSAELSAELGRGGGP